MYIGPKLIHDDLVFGYDDGYNATNTSLARGRYSNGPPHTNLMRQIGPNFTTTSTTNLTAISGTETVFIPTVGERVSKYIDYYNNHNNTGSVCCLNLFSYHTSDKIPVEASTNYTYSIIYKHTNEAAQNTNYMYRYEYNSSGAFQSIEGGVHNPNRRTHLGDGWYHAWGGFTTGSSTTQLACYTFAYDYGTNINRIHVAAISLVKNTTGGDYLIVPPHFMLEPNTTANAGITNTGSLIDLKSELDINLANASITQQGQLTFDGTDDHIALGASSQFNISNNVTIEAVVKRDSAGWNGIFGRSDGGSFIHYQLYNGQVNVYFYGPALACVSGNVITSTSKYYHIVTTFDGSSAKIYVDGSLAQSASNGNTSNISAADNVSVGKVYSSDRHFDGEIPVLKVYNMALTSSEVLQNYNAYKKRFNI